MDKNMFIQKYPDMADFVNNQVGIQGKLEVIRQPLVDRILYPTAGIVGDMTFFATPQGAGQSTESGTAAGTTKSAADTNMTQNGQLPAPQAFWVDGLEFSVNPGSVATANTYVTQLPTLFNATAAAAVQSGINDQNIILNSGAVSFSIGQKDYFNLSPLDQFPAAAYKRLDASLSIAGTNAQPAAYGAEFMYIGGEPRFFEPGFGIPTGMNFAVKVRWAALQATGSGFNARIQCQLKGWLFRAAQ